MAADGINQSQILRQRNKIRRRHKSHLLAVPADQSLCAGADIVFLNVNDWLIVHFKLFITVHCRIPHVLLHIKTLVGIRPDTTIINGNTIFTGFLRLIHSDISLANQILHVLPL